MHRPGISTSCLMDRPLFDALEELSALTDLVEIFSAAKHFLPLNPDAAESFDLRYTVHTPTSDGNIAEPVEKLRKASLEVLAESAADADRINAETLIIHPGFCMEQDLWPLSLSALKKSLRDLGRMQKNYSVRFAIENLGNWDCCQFRCPELLEDIRAADLGFCLDIGHANLTGTLDAFLREKPDHMHLHDNHGIWDEHAAL
ncbi:MAG: sugar phosphate isomerase/epimerase family protein, partial [Methanocorpusculum sp.]|nr:sugar phosphate isomerase/epimerase family protein [Methanocorpusculum sp.]